MMEHKNTIKKEISFVLALLLFAVLLCQVGFAVSAAETDTQEIVCTDEQVYIPDENALADNDELEKGYIEEVLGVSDEAAVTGSYGESGLTGLNKTIYGLLKEKITEAANATTDISTEFTLSADDLGLILGTQYTADDLNLNSITVEETDTGEISQEAQAALLNKFLGDDFDLDKIIDLLLVNCPYELYWYDKTEGCEMENSWSYVKYGSGDIVESVAVTGFQLTVRFLVASDYRLSSSEQYIVSGSTAEAVQTAKANAESIVSQNASETDYNKLLAYKNEICDLVSYNSDVSDDSYADGYGNPWQLIYVFDGEETTNVVCEGYSKAFQYLCDLSDFSNDDICCYTVTGTLSNGIDSSGHMWNIVTMDDAKNYLADITNSDSTTVGKNGELFLSGTAADSNGVYSFTVDSCTVSFTYDEDTTNLYGEDEDCILNLASSNYKSDVHTHELIYHEGAAATCTKDGSAEYWSCAGCGKLFSDKDGTTETTLDAAVIAASGHRDENSDGMCDVCSEQVSYSVTVTAMDIDGNTVSADLSGGGRVNCGEAATVSAPETDPDGYIFLGWYEEDASGTAGFSGSALSVEKEYQFTPAADYSLVAVYEAIEDSASKNNETTDDQTTTDDNAGADNDTSAGSQTTAAEKTSANNQTSAVNKTATDKKKEAAVPKKAVLRKAKAIGKKSVKVFWKKDKNANGYQIVYSYRKNFRKKVKKVYVKKNTKTSRVLKKLKKKTLYVKVRSYKTVNGKKVFGSYSKIKKVKVK